MKMAGMYYVMEYLSQPMLGTTEAKGGWPNYMMSPGSTPFFSGLEFIGTPALCREIKRCVDEQDGDTEEEKAKKRTMRSAIRCFASKQKAKNLVKTLI